MASSPKLDLPTAERTSVFRAMETIVRQNAIFGRIIKPDRFRTWEGHPRDIKPFSYQEAPCLRWTPQNGPENFQTPNQMHGDLYISCEVLVAGSCSDDMTNFWRMLETCFYPGGLPNNVIQQTLRNAGARTGLVFFTQPAFDPSPDGVFFAGAGQLKIEVAFTINT